MEVCFWNEILCTLILIWEYGWEKLEGALGNFVYVTATTTVFFLKYAMSLK